MALNGLFCADVPLRNSSLIHSRCDATDRQVAPIKKNNPPRKTAVHQQRQNEIEPKVRILYVSVCITHSANFITIYYNGSTQRFNPNSRYNQQAPIVQLFPECSRKMNQTLQSLLISSTA